MDITSLEAIPTSQFRFLQSITITKWRVRKLLRRLKTQCHFIYGNKIMYSDTSLKNVLLLLQNLTALAACRKPTLLAFCLVVMVAQDVKCGTDRNRKLTYTFCTKYCIP
jgi:hypothetical protein